MDRRDFIKKATMAAAATAVVSPVSAMINTVAGNHCKVLLINGSVFLPYPLSIRITSSQKMKISIKR